MLQTISISLTHGELSELIDGAVSRAIDRKMRLTTEDQLLTVEQATQYLNCSDVFLWKLRRDGKIDSTNAGTKILIPKSSIDSYLKLKKRPQAA